MEEFSLSSPELQPRKEKIGRTRQHKTPDGQDEFGFMLAPPIPKTYGHCLPTRADREAGKCCQHFNCRYNLIGELGRMDLRDALRCADARLRGDIKDSCALDVAERGASDREVSLLLGTGINGIRREMSETFQMIGFELSEFAPWRHPETWI